MARGQHMAKVEHLLLKRATAAMIERLSVRFMPWIQRTPGWWKVRSWLLPHLAAWRRRQLKDVTFIAVTGSAGKTTAKLVATAVLSTVGNIRPWAGTMNNFDHIMSVVLGTRPSDDFCVIEFSAHGPGYLDRSLAIVRPRIGVVTAIGTDHLKAFHSIEAIANEKAKVITALPEDGVAVLNVDDTLVASMARRFPGKAITFGVAESAMLRAENVRSAWPEPLSFTVRHGGELVEVRSRLHGKHWITAMLAGLAVGIAAGVPLVKAVKAAESVKPYTGRMYPILIENGPIFIVDDWKSALWTMASVFDFLAGARSARKIIVIGTLSDYAGTAGTVYSRVAKAALTAADYVIFVGPMATHALRAKQQDSAQRLYVFGTIKEATTFLRSFLLDGDLIVLKGTNNADHLGRIAHDWIEPISCWRTDCGKNMPCNACTELRARRLNDERSSSSAATDEVRRGSEPPTMLRRLGSPVQVIVGIGNPGSQYRATPHNIGFEVVDALAEKLGLTWASCDDASVAQTQLGAKAILLIKPQRYVNNTGSCLKQLAAGMGFKAEDCILVHDDIQLPAGKLRTRARGSDGGHKGVRSTLVAFQTNEFRRLKIGVAPAERPGSAADYLVAPFGPAGMAIIGPAIETAVSRLLSMIEWPPGPRGNGS